ncbi:helix-turn-helix transcriptional regulator [Propioniciclava soli]|uniref:WYL domain-containing protein n=1 Tax=Propioniciclava soli TaxID=2775081 RepID=A0ABZ3CB41_9ACTN|nr:WYL domain-containing protein [Propioniciclava soli]
MGMTSAAQVTRLLALVPYLQAHPDADLAATAATFGVSTRQLVADLNVLWFCGLPGGLPGDLIEVDMDALDAGRIRLSNAEFLARPLRFTMEEATSLAVALRALEEMADAELAGSVRSARAKLESLFGGAERIDVSVSAGEENVRGRLAEAIEAGVAVELMYHGASRGSVTQPVVDPVQLATRDGYGYLVAWAPERDGWRTYRLDRIGGVRVTDQPVGEHGEAPALASGWLDERPDAARVTLDLTAAGRWIVEYHPTVSVERLPGQVWRVELLVADPAWLRRLLLRLGPAVVRVDPPEAATSAVDAAREALALLRA